MHAQRSPGFAAGLFVALTLAMWQLAGSALLADDLRIEVHAAEVVQHLPRTLTGVCLEDVNHEIYGNLYSQMIFGESFQEPAQSPLAGSPEPAIAANLSGQWRGFTSGTAAGETRFETQRPFVGRQSQRLSFVGGAGTVGIANLGLYGRPPVGSPSATGHPPSVEGMDFVGGKPYEGCLWARAETPCDLAVSLENTDGKAIHAQTVLRVPGGDAWQRLPFTLTPSVSEPRGRFSVRLSAPGSVVLGYALLQPGAWGRFHGLPVRRDLADALVDQGVRVVRYGGSMVNAEGYRWKGMVGPREQRPPYRGTWYPYSTNGWAVFDFLDLCEAAGFVGIPDLNVNETPADLADFVEYVNGDAGTPWGRRRAADGHPAPYELRYLELGNEERLDENYWRKFQPLAEAIWARDPQMILVVGDFAYTRPIDDPLNLTGADSGISTLAVQQKILALARQHDREVWFDVHVNTESPDPASGSLRALPTYLAAIDKLADGARHRVVCFELNANSHDQRRALANASAILQVEPFAERLPVVTSANALQPDGHHDNGWNQGLLFSNAAHTWLQPPGYVTRLLARYYQPLLVRTTVPPADTKLEVCATRSEDGRTLVLQAVNPTAQPIPARFVFSGFDPSLARATAEQLSGPPDEANTAGTFLQIHPEPAVWQPDLRTGEAACTFAPWSFTILRLER